MGSPITLTRDGDVAILTMDDGKANALGPPLIDALLEAAQEAEREARALVLFGREGRFSGGFDLSIMGQGSERARALLHRGAELFLHLYELNIPLIVGCTGHAIAAGVLLTATGDWRIGTRGDFKLGLNEVASGMPVPILAHVLAFDRLRRADLVQSVLFSRLYGPAEAQAVGWLDEVVDAGGLREACLSKAHELSRLAGPAFAHTKRSLRARSVQHIRETLDSDLAEFSVR